MLALGIIFVLLAAALVVGVLLTGTSQQILFTSTIGDLNTQPVWVFVAGALAMLLALLGLSFLGRGTRRRVARRKEMRRLRKVEKEQAAAPAATTQPAPGGAAGTSAYDEPDRRLVREPRASDPTATTAYPAEGESGTGHVTGTGNAPGTTADDAARHRQP